MEKAGYKSLDRDMGVNRREFMGRATAEGKRDDSRWLKPDGHHQYVQV